MVKGPIKIALGDLRHSTIGKHSIYAPLGVGFLASYLLSKLPANSVEVRLFEDPDEMLSDADEWHPDVVGLANYCWNSELNGAIFDLIKTDRPETITVCGGPEFPPEEDTRATYLAFRPQIDFYCPNEGEIAFAGLMGKVVNGESLQALRQSSQYGLLSLSADGTTLIKGEVASRTRNLDLIPSPYLTGLMDKWLNGEFIPLIETARGCPFSCTFCSQGVLSYNKLAVFSPERVGEEVRYIAHKLKDHPGVRLGITDSNFGMYPRDVEVATQIGRVMEETDWPRGIQVTTGKTNHERILEVAGQLKNRMEINCATQSMDDNVLEKIKRKNLSTAQYQELRAHVEGAGMRMIGEIIVPLPGETKETFFEGVNIVADIGIEMINVYTTMMLLGTDLNSAETRDKYGLVTRFRCLPRQFGDYRGRKVFEIEEVCIGTNTMSHEDYNICRGLALVSTVFASEQYDAVRRVLKEFGLKFSTFLLTLYDRIHKDTSPTSIRRVYDAYLESTNAELYPSKEALYAHFSDPGHYEEILKGEAGDNLLRRFRALMHLQAGKEFTRLTMNLIREMAGSPPSDDGFRALDALEKWMLATRDLAPVFEISGPPTGEEVIDLEFDVAGWYEAKDEEPLWTYDCPTSYRLSWDKEKIDNIVGQSHKMYSGDIEHNASRVIFTVSLSELWRRYDLIPSGPVISSETGVSHTP